VQFSNKFYINSLYCSQITGGCLCLEFYCNVKYFSRLLSQYLHLPYLFLFCMFNMPYLCVGVFLYSCYYYSRLSGRNLKQGTCRMQSKASSLRTLMLFVSFQVLRLPLINKTAKSNHFLMWFDHNAYTRLSKWTFGDVGRVAQSV
jgi:hypothetical protein